MLEALRLRQYEPNTKNIQKLETFVTIGYISGDLIIEISDNDIVCKNEDEVRKAIKRRAKEYFDNVNEVAGAIHLEIECKKGWLTGEIRPKHIVSARKEADTAFKNTIDDVFGVGCVGVEK